MRHAITCRAAAAEIAKPEFPDIELPRVAPLPYCNLGHLVLFDYDLFARAVWGTVFDLKAHVVSWRTTAGERDARATIAAIITFFIIVAAAACTLSGGVLAAGLIIGTLVAVGVKAGMQFQGNIGAFNESARKIRTAAIEKLLEGNTEGMTEHAELKSRWIEWGTGSLGGSAAPVLTASDQRPFPGFGRVQVDQLFVTPEAADRAELSDEEIRDIIHTKVLHAAMTAGFPNIIVGPVVVLHGASLRNNSPWLSGASGPLLWLDINEINHVADRDPIASVRDYLAVQILFPDHETSATFFLRTFKAGNAASVEIHLTTLGPLESDDRHTLQRMMRLRTTTEADYNAFKVMRKTAYANLLRGLGLIIIGGEDWISEERISKVALDRLTPFDLNEATELRAEADNLNERLVGWPGNWAGISNWREQHSKTLTSDYFGATECRAALRALYERVAAAALDALHEHGFDISKYRDRDGKWQVHADKIDSIVIGERIVMNAPVSDKDSKNDKDNKEPAKKAA